jgi:uncharacterized protein GlcG (DUF336 family)
MQTLLLHQAAKIVELSLQTGREIGCKPPTVAVLDAGGHLLAFQRADGSGILRPQIAQTKRRGVLGMGHGGRASAQRAAATPGFFAALSGISEGRIAPVPGGVIVRDATGNAIGSVGIGGDMPDQDKACAVFGIGLVGLQADVNWLRRPRVGADRHPTRALGRGAIFPALKAVNPRIPA